MMDYSKPYTNIATGCLNHVAPNPAQLVAFPDYRPTGCAAFRRTRACSARVGAGRLVGGCEYRQPECSHRPSVSFPILTKVAYNDTVTLVGRTDKGTWVQVRTARNFVGWMNSIYLRTYADLSLLPVTYITPAVPPPSLVVPPPGSGAVGQQVYTVRAGDTLAGIAAKYGTTVASLMASNGISNANRIYTGQQILITYGVSVPTTPVTGNAGSRIHVVAAGETLSIIAAKYGTTWSAIAAANSLYNANVIYTGQRLIIPAAGAVTTAPTTPTTPTTVVQPRYYTVQRGDTLFSIAQRFGTTIVNLTALNSLANPNAIKAGQTLRVA